MKELPRIEFGHPSLRQTAKQLNASEIMSAKTQALIKNMRHTLMTKKLGVALAAPQVGQNIALSVIAIRPTAHRPHADPFDLVIINPKITQTFGRRQQMWEGCLSAGPSGLFAKVPRYRKLEASFTDETGKKQTKLFEDLQAQIIQHETDHLNGVLFVDHVKDPTTFMTLKEYKRRVVAKRK